MERVGLIITHHSYLEYLYQNEAAEKERIFCGHNFDHLLTVARLTCLLLLEEGNSLISREMAYAAALLHDIGRWQEYSSCVDHAESSAVLAGPILADAGFSIEEAALIVKAIRQHRLDENADIHRSPLSRALNKADRYARLCFRCDACDRCNKREKMPHKHDLKY